MDLERDLRNEAHILVKSPGSERRDVKGGRGVNGVTKRGIRRLNSQVSQHEGVSLDAVTLLVIISGIEKLPGKIGPLTSHTFSIQVAHMHQLLLQGQNSSCVGTLRTSTHNVNSLQNAIQFLEHNI